MLDSTEHLQALSLLLALAKASPLCLNGEFEIFIVRGGCASSWLHHELEISIVRGLRKPQTLDQEFEIRQPPQSEGPQPQHKNR